MLLIVMCFGYRSRVVGQCKLQSCGFRFLFFVLIFTYKTWGTCILVDSRLSAGTQISVGNLTICEFLNFLRYLQNFGYPQNVLVTTEILAPSESQLSAKIQVPQVLQVNIKTKNKKRNPQLCNQHLSTTRFSTRNTSLIKIIKTSIVLHI